MKRLLTVLLISTLLAACDGAPLSTCPLTPVTRTEGACNYRLPAGLMCSKVTAYADGKALASAAYSIVCDAGVLHVDNCDERVIEVCTE